MKRIAAVVIVSIVACVCLVASGPGEQGQKGRPVLASGSMFTWLSEAGTVTCIGGELTGTFFPPCTPGTRRVVMRQFVFTFTFAQVTGSGSTYVGGTILAPGNCNLNAELRGQCWGTFEGPSPAGGQWDGVWSGEIDFQAFGGDITMVGHGSGSPEVDGLVLRVDSESPGTGNPADPMPFTARIMKATR